MRVIRASHYTGTSPWDAELIASIDDTTVRLHWTDEPYVWHVNDGEEVFVVLDGAIDMYVRDGRDVDVHRLEIGDIFHAELGTEHVAHPIGPSRVLVIEKSGSI